MRIIAKSKGLTKQDQYKLMSPAGYTNMRDKVGQTVKIAKFTIHQEQDEYNGNKKVLAIETPDGELIVSASRSLVGEFEKLVAIFGATAVKEIEILESETASGYDALTCRFTALAM